MSLSAAFRSASVKVWDIPQQAHVSANHRQRSPEFVRGVGHEPPLGRKCFRHPCVATLESVKHGVEGFGETTHLIVGAGLRHAFTEILSLTD